MVNKLSLLSVAMLAATVGVPIAATAQTKVISHVIEYNGSVTNGRIDYTYDQQGRVTEKLTTRPDSESGELENSERENYGYDDQGRRNVVEKYLYDENTWQWYANPVENDAKTVTTFNDENRPSEVFYYDNYNGNSWSEQYDAHGVFEYNGNKATETRNKYKDGIAVSNSSTIINYTFDDNWLLTEKTTSLSMDIDWDYENEEIPQDRWVYEYDTNGNVSLEEHYNNFSGGEEPSWALMYRYKYEYEYDTDGNITRKTKSVWRDYLEDYEVESDLTYEYFYGTNDALELPYSNHFDSADSFDGFSTEDGNEDGNTWAMGNGTISCTSSKASEGPDIVYLPAIRFTTDYEVEVTLKAKVADASKPGKLGLVLFDNDEKHTALGPIGEIREITGTEYTEVTGRILVDKNSPYVIGISFDNNQVGSTVIIDDIEVKNGRSSDTPAAPYYVTATPANDGSLQVEIRYIPYPATIGGEYLNKVDKTEVYRGDELVHTTGEIGTSLEERFVDNTIPGRGEYTYRIYSYVGSMRSDAAVVTVKVGYPVPQQITGFKVVENEDHSVTLSWDAPAAEDGDVKYWILRNNEEIEREFVGTSYTDRGIDTSAGQAYCYYMVQPYNEMGPAQATYSELLFVGEPNPVPFMESWAGGYGTYQWMNDEITLTADSQWGFGGHLEGSNVTPQDNDGGMAVFLSRNESEDATEVVRFTCEKIDLSSTTAPEMAFFMYHLTGEATGDAIVVEASTDNGEFKIMSDPIPVSGYATEGWTQHIIPLDGFAGEKNVRIGLRGISSGTHHIFIDNLIVGEKGCAGVEPVITGNTRIYSLNGEIIVNAASESDIKVFSINGTQIYAGTATTANIPVAQGIYVVAINGQASKVIVK